MGLRLPSPLELAIGLVLPFSSWSLSKRNLFLWFYKNTIIFNKGCTLLPYLGFKNTNRKDIKPPVKAHKDFRSLNRKHFHHPLLQFGGYLDTLEKPLLTEYKAEANQDDYKNKLNGASASIEFNESLGFSKSEKAVLLLFILGASTPYIADLLEIKDQQAARFLMFAEKKLHAKLDAYESKTLSLPQVINIAINKKLIQAPNLTEYIYFTRHEQEIIEQLRTNPKLSSYELGRRFKKLFGAIENTVTRIKQKFKLANIPCARRCDIPKASSEAKKLGKLPQESIVLPENLQQLKEQVHANQRKRNKILSKSELAQRKDPLLLSYLQKKTLEIYKVLENPHDISKQIAYQLVIPEKEVFAALKDIQVKSFRLLQKKGFHPNPEASLQQLYNMLIEENIIQGEKIPIRFLIGQQEIINLLFKNRNLTVTQMAQKLEVNHQTISFRISSIWKKFQDAGLDIRDRKIHDIPIVYEIAKAKGLIRSFQAALIDIDPNTLPITKQRANYAYRNAVEKKWIRGSVHYRGFSDEELTVLNQLPHTVEDIATRMQKPIIEVIQHLKGLYEKLGIQNYDQLCFWADKTGLRVSELEVQKKIEQGIKKPKVQEDPFRTRIKEKLKGQLHIPKSELEVLSTYLALTYKNNQTPRAKEVIDEMVSAGLVLDLSEGFIKVAISKAKGLLCSKLGVKKNPIQSFEEVFNLAIQNKVLEEFTPLKVPPRPRLSLGAVEQMIMDVIEYDVDGVLTIPLIAEKVNLWRQAGAAIKDIKPVTISVHLNHIREKLRTAGYLSPEKVSKGSRELLRAAYLQFKRDEYEITK